MATTTTQTSDAADDRRRARDQRGIRSSQTMKADRIPSPPRQRRPALAALAVLLIVGGAAVAALLAMRVDSRVPVLQANQTIYPGQVLNRDMFDATPVAAEGTGLVPESQLDQVLGLYASTTISESQLLDATMLSREGFLDSGKVAVGAALPVGRYPAEGLRPGDVVDLVRVADENSTVFVRGAQVSSMAGASLAEDAGGGANAVLQISLIVSRGDAADVAAANANNQLSVVLVERGGGIDATAGSGGVQDVDESADDGSGDTNESDQNGEDGPSASDEG